MKFREVTGKESLYELATTDEANSYGPNKGNFCRLHIKILE